MSKQINSSIIIDAKVRATLEGMNEVVSKLNQGLREGTAKLDLTKGVGSSLSKQMDKFKDEYSKFSKYIEGGKIDFADSKDAIKSGETLIKTFKEMRRIIGDFDDLTIIDAKRLFPDAFDSRVSDLLKGLNGLSSAMTKLGSKQLDLATAQTEMGELTREAQRLQSLIDQEISLKLELDQAESDLKHFDSEIEAIRAKAAKGITLKINTAEAAHDEAKKGVEEIETARKARGFSQEDFSGTTARAVKFKGKTEKQWTDQSTKKDASEASKAEAAAALKAIRIYRQEENALKDLNAMLQARKKEIDSLRESLSNINNMKVSQAVKVAGGTAEEINEANAAMQVQAEAATEAATARGRYNTAVQQAKGASDKIEKTNAALEAQQAKIDKITLEIGELNKEVSTEALEKAFSTAGVEGFNASMLRSKEGIEELRNKLNQLDEERLAGLKKALSDIGLGADKAEEYVDQLRGTLGSVKESADDIKRSASEMENLKNQVLQFFSLTNSAQLFKRAVTEAMNTVKELDATMTEAAVVTNFSVGDMWDKLPKYSKQAQELGVSINGLYQATTLYYQQGLKTNEAMQLGIETMKMGKIAGIDSAEATTAMTSALRGFNMELERASATKVSDVYSKLAAMSASNTSQIATAMEKTASIAASANMEFETTAALLAQIIETTQEAPETAGTAMKTIIARFSEVKSLRSQGLLSGEDSEGEAIDVNKIQTALRTVGISMEGFFAGTEGLDSVLLKLAEKWNTLDFETQRYIATMAAGSRQQSRFIAMMSDYGRTTELVTAANNSAGASQIQYGKTLDSMESKLQRLKNAWNEFLMNLSNNTILKAGVDILTFVINGINKLNGLISGGNGLTKSIASLITVVSGLAVGKRLLTDMLGGFAQKIGLITKKAAAKNDLSKANENVVATEKQIIATTQDTAEGFNNSTEAAKKHTKTIGEMTGSMRAVGGAMMGVGALLGILATAFEKMGNTKAAEVISVIAAAFMGLGAILTVLPSLITAFGTTAVSTGVAVQLAWWWLLIIAAVIMTIIALVYVLCKAFEAASDAAQFEKMSEQLSDLSAAADEAKEKLEAIADTRKALEEMEETFKNLTKGSREWKEALIENNSQVLELLNTYPELAKHIKTGLYGQMEITDLGWDTILESQQQAYANAYTAQTTQAQLVADKSMSMKMEQIAGEAIGKKGQMAMAEFADTGYGKAALIGGGAVLGPALAALTDPTLASQPFSPFVGLASLATIASPEEVEKKQLGLTYDQYTDYAAAVAEQGLSFATSDRRELERVFDEMNFEGDFEDVYSSMKKLGKSFDELAQEAHAAKLAEEARVKAIVSSNAQASEIVQGSEYSEAIQDFTSQQYENYANLAKEAASEWEYKEGKGTDNAKNAALITAYAEAQKMAEDEVRAKLKDESLSYATMAATVGSDEINKEMIESMETLTKGLERVGKGKTKKDMSLITGLMSEGGLGLTRKDLDKIEKSSGDLKTFLMNTYGFTDDELTDTQMTILEQNQQAAKEGLKNAYVYSESLLGKETPIKGIINDLNKEFVSLGVSSGLLISQEQALANTLTDIAIRGGDAQETTELFGQMMEGIGSQNAELAQGIIAETDWSDELSIRSAVDSLRELGAQIDNTLVSEVLRATKATRDFDLKNMTDRINAAKEDIDMVKEKRDNFSKTYTEEEKKKLEKYGYTDKDFVYAGSDEYIFLGDTNALLEDIRSQVTAIADETLKGQRESVQKGLQVEDKIVELSNQGEYGKKFAQWIKGDTVQEEVQTKVEADATQTLENLRNFELSLKDSLNITLNDFLKAYYGGEGVLTSEMKSFYENNRELFELAESSWSYDEKKSDTDNETAFRQTLSQAKHYGYITSTKEWNPTRAEMESVADDFGIEYNKDTTDEGLKKAIQDHANTYYKDLAANTKQYLGGLDKASEISMYQVIGTSDIVQAQTEASSIQKALTESDTDFYYKTSHGQDISAEEYERVGVTGLELAKLIAQGQVDAWGTGGTENISSEMLKTLAMQMGIKGVDEVGDQQLIGMIGESFWSNFTLDENNNVIERADKVLDAYIGNHAGLAMAVENSVEQLKAEESAAANDTLAVKNLAVAVNKTGEAMDGLNGVLKDEAEFLELNDENNQQYRSALAKTAAMAQDVFGKQVTDEFVAAHRDLFIQLTKGGAAAEEAYYKIGQAAVEAEMKARGYTKAVTGDAITIINQYLANVKPGETIDLSELQNRLNEAIDMTAEASAQMIDLLGFSVSYSVEADSYIATRESAIGTGVNAFDSGDEDVWENPYDMLYNTLERINEAMREREKIERRYQRLLEREDVSGQKVVENLREQVAQLQEEANLQNDVVVARKQQMQDLVDQKGLSQYAWLENGKIRIDWGAIDKITDSDRGEEVEEYISQLEEWRDSLNEAEDRLEEIQDEVKEINDTGKEEYLNLENAIKEALIDSYQKQIDKLSDINDSINDTNSKLIESIQSTIDKDRQARENNETEQSIIDKQQQLAQLRQDTSGANALDILKLQEEIETAQVDYTDQLIDQKISDLQEQNEKAAEQRERQIEIAQQQLDHYVAAGEIWNKVSSLISEGVSKTGELLTGTDLATLLTEAASFDGMSKQDKMVWFQETNANIARAWAWMQEHGKYIVNAGTQNQSNSDLNNVYGYNYNNEGSGGEVPGSEANTIKRLQNILHSEGIYQGNIDGSYGSQSKKAVLEYQKKYGLDQNVSDYGSVIEDYESRHTYEGIVGKPAPSNKGSVQSGRLPGSYDKYGTNFTVDENGVSHLTNQKGLAMQLTGDKDAEVIYIPLWGGNIPEHLEKNRGRYFGLTKYKTGGLADYTGPAWLDGTKSKPELVLNARDTQNFIQLKDVLASIMNQPGKTSENSGATNFDIDINVETINSETDLDMIANYIENKIVSSAGYRNNNLIKTSR